MVKNGEKPTKPAYFWCDKVILSMPIFDTQACVKIRQVAKSHAVQKRFGPSNHALFTTLIKYG